MVLTAWGDDSALLHLVVQQVRFLDFVQIDILIGHFLGLAWRPIDLHFALFSLSLLPTYILHCFVCRFCRGTPFLAGGGLASVAFGGLGSLWILFCFICNF